MDINSLIANEKGAKLHIIHPATNEETGIMITLVGADSVEWKTAMRSIRTRSLQNGKRKISDEEAESMPFEMLAAVTLDWDGVEENGKPIKFSKEEALRIYKTVPVIAEQVDKFVGDRANFLPSA